jgi:hypothetical protein
MNYDRIYEYRFKDASPAKKQIVWRALSRFVHRKYLLSGKAVLDPAAGNCEFVNSIDAPERWAVDMNPSTKNYAAEGVRVEIGNVFDVVLPENHFDAVFISNFLEHLNSQAEVAIVLGKMYASLKKGGRIAIMGPNFKYCYRDYFDFADHTVILSDVALAEHLYGAGFKIVRKYPRFLPLSFRSGGLFPINDFTAGVYLNNSIFWKFLGKQFLVVAEK